MNEVTACIDLEGKKMAYSPKDIQKLSEEDGCPLTLVNEKVYNLDDSNASEGDEHNDSFEECSSINREAKIERMKREYISMALNSNRDPMKPGESPNTAPLLPEDHDLMPEDSGYPRSKPDDGYSSVHRRHARTDKYEDIMNGDSFAPYVEIASGVFKNQYRMGSGLRVSEDSFVIYHCALWKEGSAEPFDSSWLRGSTMVVDLKDDSIIAGLRELMLTCSNGEICEAFIRPEKAFGMLGAPPRIPGNAIIFAVIEIIKVIARDKFTMLTGHLDEEEKMAASFDDLYKISDEARTRGNFYYEQKQYRKALQRYKSGVRILEACTFKDECQERKANGLLLKLYNNSARAANALGDPRFALSACKQASLLGLSEEPKTYWNRMVAWKTKGHLDRALGVARRAMQLFPEPKTRKTFEREAEVLKKRLQNENVELDELYRLMGRAILA